MSELPKKLSSKPFTWKEAKKAGLTQHAIRNLVINGSIERIAYGVYQSTDVYDHPEFNQNKSALLRVGKPSAIGLLSALAHYHLTDTIPQKIWIIVPAEKVCSQKDIRVWRRRNPKWRIGIGTVDGLRITTIERTLIECLHYSDLAGGVPHVLTSIKLAIREKKTTMSSLLKIAERLKLKTKVLPYLEAIL